jgi:hypothetical protein
MGRIRRDDSRRVLLSGMLVAIVGAVAVAGNTDLAAPPRYDGAGYAVLGEALATGRGYREIDQPDQPRHAHYPPGYPVALALIWRSVGRSVESAHLFSGACTVAATVAAWCWFRTLYPARVAWLLGLALAANWTWGRIGGAIQSEPLFGLLETCVLLAASGACRGVGNDRRRDLGSGIGLGIVLGMAILTRHVAVSLALALGLDLALRRRWVVAISAGLVAMVPILLWAGWLASVRHDTQIGLLARDGLAPRVVRQLLFYVQRIPDQLTGPAVEIGTVFRRSGTLSVLVNLWAILATGLVIVGWLRTLRTRRRRLAGLVPLASLPLLLIWPFTEAGRFLIPLVPFLLVGAVEGLAVVSARLGLRRPRVWAAGALLAVALPYSVYAIVTDRAGAQRDVNRDFDAACAWIAGESTPDGPIFSRHPGEVYWLTGRQALAARSDDPAAIDRAIDRYRVAYLLVDEERYARAPANPLTRYATARPGRVRRVWHRETGRVAIDVYEVVRDAKPAGRAGAEPG